MKYALLLGGVLLLSVVGWLLIRTPGNEAEEPLVSEPFVEEEEVVVQPEPEVEEDPALAGVVSVAVGATAQVDAFVLTFNELVADYRCPAVVQCIEAGAVVVNVTMRAGEEEETRNVSSDEVPHVFAGYEVSIEGVEPPLVSEAMLDPEAYIVTFKIEAQE